MAVILTRPISALEETHYSNFEIIGESTDNWLICHWEEEVLIDSEKHEENILPSLSVVTHIGILSPDLIHIQILYIFDKVVHVTQASVNSSKTLLAFIVCDGIDSNRKSQYSAYVAEVSPQGILFSLNIDCLNMLMVEFLQSEDCDDKLSNSCSSKLLVFVHHKSIAVYSFPLHQNEQKSWVLDGQPLTEVLVSSFSWAQWIPSFQHLYCLHIKSSPDYSFDSVEEEGALTYSMLTAYQFYPDKLHETVLNVPLELSGLDYLPMEINYDIKTRKTFHVIGDPWLDLAVLCAASGAVCMCHRYMYKSCTAETPADPENCQVFIAYSVTILHHGSVLHVVMPEVTWSTANSAVPLYSFYGGICFHILDVGLCHLPSNHIVAEIPKNLLVNSLLYPITMRFGGGRHLHFIDIANHLIVEIRMTKETIYNIFKTSKCLQNKLSVLHMAGVHDKDHDLTRKLMWSMCEDSFSMSNVQLMQEYLTAEAYCIVAKHLDTDAVHLLSFLPITTSTALKDTEYQESFSTPSTKFKYCILENAVSMLLSPRERIFKGQDIWTHLWNYSCKPIFQRFSHKDVVAKLLVSLDTYKPEALSQGNTPLSPANAFATGTTISSLGLTLAHLMFDPLPFNETENTTSSKLEHLLSVNLREFSMYCLKHLPQESPIRVHAVASKYVSSQLQVSRRLCSILCSSQTFIPVVQVEKGFSFIMQLEDGVAGRIFFLLEQYYCATETLAFPLPQGYNSFFAVLGYKCLPTNVYIQYIKRGVFQLNVDAMKAILCYSDNKQSYGNLELLSSLPLVRSFRGLQYWDHPMSSLLLSRLHSSSVLAGESSAHSRKQDYKSCLDSTKHQDDRKASVLLPAFKSFLDLLSAKGTDCMMNKFVIFYVIISFQQIQLI